MPIPLLIPAVSALPKVFQGAKKLFSKGKNFFKGIKKKIGKCRPKNKIPTVVDSTPETTAVESNYEQMNDEQTTNNSENTQKSFLGLQTVNESKKQQSKIIMIAGAVILVLFFIMKKK